MSAPSTSFSTPSSSSSPSSSSPKIPPPRPPTLPPTSSFFQRSRRLLAICAAFAVFLFFACYIFYLLRLGETIPDLDTVFSAPSRVIPGQTQDILLHAFLQGSDQRATGLDLELTARAPAPIREILLTQPFRETKPGLYIARIQLPGATREGEITFSAIPAGKPRFPLSTFIMRAGNRPAIAAIPPTQHVHAGDPVLFRLALLDGETASPIARRPIRCRVFTPDGIEVVNRLRSFSPNGLGSFRFRLHPFAPTGTWQVYFTVGDSGLRFELPVQLPAPPARRGTSSVSRWLNRLAPRVLPPVLVPRERVDFDWRMLPRPGERRRSSARLISHPSKNMLTLDLRPRVSRRTTILEAWQGDRFLKSYEFSPVEGGLTRRIIPPQVAPRPVRWRLWQLGPGPSAPLERVVPWLPSGLDAADRFFILAGLSGDRSSAERVLESLLVGPPGTLVRRKAVIKPHILALHLGRIANLVFVAFPVIFALGFLALLWTLPRFILADTTTYQALKLYLALSVILYGFYLLGFTISRDIGIPVSLIAILAFALLGRFWTAHHGLNTYARLGSSFLLLGLYMAILMLLSQAWDRLGLVRGMIEPIGLLLGLSVVSVPVFFVCIGLLHLDQVPRKMADAGGTVFSRLLKPFSSGTPFARILQFALPAGLFYVFFAAAQHLSAPPRPILQSEGSSHVSSLSGFSVHAPPLVFRAFDRSKPSKIIASNATISSNSSIASITSNTSISSKASLVPSAPKLEPASHSAVFSATSKPPNPGRFFLVNASFAWNDGRIETIRIFQNPRDYLDRLTIFSHNSKSDFSSLAREFLVRSERFELLSDQERNDEGMTLEALMGPICHLIASPSAKLTGRSVDRIIPLASPFPGFLTIPEEGNGLPISKKAILSKAVLHLLERAERLIGVDHSLLAAWRSLSLSGTPAQSSTLLSEDPFSLHLRPEDHPTDLLRPLKAQDCFRGGGIFSILGTSKSRTPLPVRGETLVLQRGISFPRDLEIKGFDIRREAPLLLEIEVSRGF
ncbi:MAG: hypothetical protein WA705_24490 [Candidatus Ozemobacteraceae bacterium]